MLLHNLAWFSLAAMPALFFAANAARAEQESDDLTVGSSIQGADVACELGGDNAESRMCGSAQLRWRLCEQGFRSEQLPDADVDMCFLRSQ
jgi:hypothetical protein